MASKAIILDTRSLRVPSRHGLGSASRDGLLMLAAALLLRCWWFGNPVVQVDEQFYLLVGDRMLHGALPFVDIWDRKPIGLFLIYAGIRLLGGAGIIEYQVVATLCATASACLTVRMARLFASEAAARLAGVASLIWLIIFDGAGGQSPIFYNPLVAGAALLTLNACKSTDFRRIAGLGTAAMALIGVAIQIKYTALFEGIGLGLLLLWHGWQARIRLPRLAALALLWIGVALLPTILAFAVYAGWGDARAFFFANFLSVGQRSSPSPPVLARRLTVIALQASPLVLAAIVAMRARPDGEAAATRRCLLAWLAAAVVGMLSIGAFYTHYFLPVIPPLSVAAAPAFDRVVAIRGRSWRPALLLLPIGAAIALGLSIARLHQRGDGREVRAIASAIPPRLDGCLFVFDGEPILYEITHACLASHYAFPGHLNERKEADAIGTDPASEIARIMATRPAMIVTSDRPGKDGNTVTWAAMRRDLQQGYELIAAVPVHHRIRLVYRRIA